MEFLSLLLQDYDRLCGGRNLTDDIDCHLSLSDNGHHTLRIQLCSHFQTLRNSTQLLTYFEFGDVGLVLFIVDQLALVTSFVFAGSRVHSYF